MMYYWALCKGLTHITDIASPETAQLFLGSGYKAVAATFTHGPSQRPALPVVLDIAELDPRFTAFVDKQQLRHFLQSFERQFHQKGEHIIRRGEAGTAAFVNIEGRVGVSVGGGPYPLPRRLPLLPRRFPSLPAKSAARTTRVPSPSVTPGRWGPGRWPASWRSSPPSPARPT